MTTKMDEQDQRSRPEKYYGPRFTGGEQEHRRDVQLQRKFVRKPLTAFTLPES